MSLLLYHQKCHQNSITKIFNFGPLQSKFQIC